MNEPTRAVAWISQMLRQIQGSFRLIIQNARYRCDYSVQQSILQWPDVRLSGLLAYQKQSRGIYTQNKMSIQVIVIMHYTHVHRLDAIMKTNATVRSFWLGLLQKQGKRFLYILYKVKHISATIGRESMSWEIWLIAWISLAWSFKC